jgi:hypothetical protein
MEAVARCYPEYKWDDWKKDKKYFGYWKELQNQRAVMGQIAKKLNVKVFEDWYSVSVKDVS